MVGAYNDGPRSSWSPPLAAARRGLFRRANTPTEGLKPSSPPPRTLRSSLKGVWVYRTPIGVLDPGYLRWQVMRVERKSTGIRSEALSRYKSKTLAAIPTKQIVGGSGLVDLPAGG
jgi:hypothetical protein